MLSYSSALSLVNKLRSAEEESRRWPGVLAKMAQEFGADDFIFVAFDRAKRLSHGACGTGDWNRWPALCDALQRECGSSARMLTGSVTLRQGAVTYMAAPIFEDRQYCAFFTLVRCAETASALQDRRDDFAQLVPHLRLSLACSARLCVDKAFGVSTLSDAPLGGALFSSQGDLLHISDGLAALFAECDGVELKEGRLFFQRAFDGQRFAAARDRALGTPGVPQILCIPRRSGKRPYVAAIRPLRRPLHYLLQPIAGAVILADSSRFRAVPGPLLREAFGLTGREAEIVALLLRGSAIPEAAKQLSMSQDTARKHLKHVFRKTDTHRQAELLSLLHHMAGTLAFQVGAGSNGQH